jgi:hypothetical protein
VLVSRREYLEEEKKENAKQQVPNSEDYTIFHALVETMVKKKEEKNNGRSRFLRKLKLSK